MEQRWTVDRYDVPSGDLEFWALRRGKVPYAANQNDRGYVPTRARQMLCAPASPCSSLSRWGSPWPETSAAMRL